jgi:cytochrome o ubiquinol oxidase subunit III
MHSCEINHESDSTDVFGFWLYILTDCILFASLFATFVVLNKPASYGIPLKSLINIDYALGETFILLASNFCFGLAVLALKNKKRATTQACLLITFILGAIFVAMELFEFYEMVNHGYSWQTSGASSAFFTLVGTHGLHVTFGLFWIIILMCQISVSKLQPTITRRMTYLGLFWNFLDIVWIFLFSIVYLLGSIL